MIDPSLPRLLSATSGVVHRRGGHGAYPEPYPSIGTAHRNETAERCPDRLRSAANSGFGVDYTIERRYRRR
ncbi:hypothetical protein DVR14_05245 [Natrinema thermotolerans]|nr:hypothetical protein DVR14_05245 [Natrinema thermotolerans]